MRFGVILAALSLALAGAPRASASSSDTGSTSDTGTHRRTKKKRRQHEAWRRREEQRRHEREKRERAEPRSQKKASASADSDSGGLEIVSPVQEPPIPPMPPLAAPAAKAAPGVLPPPTPTAPELLTAPPAKAAPKAAAAPRLGWRISPTVAAGVVSETTLDTTAPVFLAGIGGEWDFKKPMSLSLDFADRFYSRLYATKEPDQVAQAPQEATVSEQDLGVDLLFGYDLAPAFKWPKRIHLTPLVGPAVSFFQNEAFASEAGGIAVGGRVSYRLSPRLEIGGSGTWAYNAFFKNPTLDSALGGPVAVTELNAYLGLRLAPRTRLDLGYSGEIVTLERSYRLVHALAFTFDVLL